MLSSASSIIAASAGFLSIFPAATSGAPVVGKFPNVFEMLQKRDAQPAPHQFYYSDQFVQGENGPPNSSAIPGWNNFGLSFWLTSGPADQVQSYVSLTDDQRNAVKTDYAAAGIKLIVSAFGSTETPTTSGADPTKTASDLAAFVKQYDLDGVDVDYEDFDAIAQGTAEDWLITLTQSLREQLPQGQYQLTHAPIAPWFTSNNASVPGGGYLKVHQSVGDQIDFYNLQYYSQGTSYTSCDALFTKSDLNGYEQTSINEIIANGVTGDKLVLGKPGNQGDASSGFVDPATLAGCVSGGKASGWNGGLMIWEYPDAPTDYVSQVWGS